MFEAEAQDWQMLETDAIRVPKPLWGTAAGSAYLVLEWLELPWILKFEKMGRRLAAMHSHTSNKRLETKNNYWFHAQINTWTADG